MNRRRRFQDNALSKGFIEKCIPIINTNIECLNIYKKYTILKNISFSLKRKTCLRLYPELNNLL